MVENVAAGRTLFGHPVGLFLLFFAELWGVSEGPGWLVRQSKTTFRRGGSMKLIMPGSPRKSRKD